MQRGGNGAVVESVRSLVSPSGAALHDLFSTRRRREREGACKREKEREERAGTEEGAGIEYRNFNIKQRAVECRSNLPGKRSSRRGWVQRVLAPAPPICVHSVHSPNLHMFLPHNFLAKQGHALASVEGMDRWRTRARGPRERLERAGEPREAAK